MKLILADGIRYVLDNAKISDTKKVDKILTIIAKIQEAQFKKADEYSKIVEANLEVKKDDQGTPIIQDGEEVKFLSTEGRKQLNDLELEFVLDERETKLVKECIDNVIGVLTGEPQDVYSLRIKLVDLYKTL